MFSGCCVVCVSCCLCQGIVKIMACLRCSSVPVLHRSPSPPLHESLYPIQLVHLLLIRTVLPLLCLSPLCSAFCSLPYCRSGHPSAQMIQRVKSSNLMLKKSFSRTLMSRSHIHGSPSKSADGSTAGAGPAVVAGAGGGGVPVQDRKSGWYLTHLAVTVWLVFNDTYSVSHAILLLSYLIHYFRLQLSPLL